jgi:hypothetical protein
MHISEEKCCYDFTNDWRSGDETLRRTQRTILRGIQALVYSPFSFFLMF